MEPNPYREDRRRAEALAQWAERKASVVQVEERSAVFYGLLNGLTMGLAFSHLNTDWARAAYQELRASQRSYLKQDGRPLPPALQRLVTFQEADEIIRQSGTDDGNR
jgi:hypothetical protein